MRNMLHFLSCILFLCLLFSCNGAIIDPEQSPKTPGQFTLQAKYDSIRSCPGGGGLFVITAINLYNPFEIVSLQVDCDSHLNASLTRQFISSRNPVFEVVIDPVPRIPIAKYDITVTGRGRRIAASVTLHVEVLNWENASQLSDIAAGKKNAFVDWLNANFPEINITHQTDWNIYSTYPQVIIVEHYTLINHEYEMRLCSHAMIPPSDWSMIRLRKRNTWEPFLAARQDTAGDRIYEIPVDEYPLMFGY